jgi:RHS repeat-associated protein
MPMSVAYTTIDGEIVSESRGGVTRAYVPDTNGNTAALLDESGNITDTYSYWPFGEIRNHVGTSQTPFTYGGTLGYYLDLLNYFLYIRARYLRQALARWQTVDPLWPQQRAYAYCFANPLIYVDPRGDEPVLAGNYGASFIAVATAKVCWVRVCTEDGGHFWNHQYICSNPGSGTPCIGSYYQGGIDSKWRCQSGGNTICKTYSTSCKDAQNMCNCIKIADKNPKWFWYSSGLCHGASTNLLSCMNNGGNWNPPSHF